MDSFVSPMVMIPTVAVTTVVVPTMVVVSTVVFSTEETISYDAAFFIAVGYLCREEFFQHCFHWCLFEDNKESVFLYYIAEVTFILFLRLGL